VQREEWTWGDSRLVIDERGLTATEQGRSFRHMFVPWRSMGKITREVRSRGTRAAGIVFLVVAAASGAYSIAIAQNYPYVGSSQGNGGAVVFGLLGLVLLLLPNRITQVGVFGHAGQSLWVLRRLGRRAEDDEDLFRLLVEGAGGPEPDRVVTTEDADEAENGA